MTDLNLPDKKKENTIRYIRENYTGIDGVVINKDVEWLLDCSEDLLTALSNARDEINNANTLLNIYNVPKRPVIAGRIDLMAGGYTSDLQKLEAEIDTLKAELKERKG